jgi:hypothetical protein
MNPRRLLALACLPAAVASAQPANLINEASALSVDPVSGAWNFQWWGTTGRTYFIQNSDLQLANWVYWPVIEQGTGAWINYGFWTSPRPDRLFLRLRYTDQPSTDPYGDDFDGDGIPNGWEIENGLNPFDAADAALLNGGLTNLEIYQQSQGGGADPAMLNPVGLMVYSP